MTVAGANTLALGAVYLYRGTLHLVLPTFWEYKMEGTEVALMLWVAGGLLLTHGALIGWLGRRGRVGERRGHSRFESMPSWLAPAAGALLSVAYALTRFGANTEFSHASLQELTSGTAWTPYQFRVLVPWAVRALLDLGVLSQEAWHLGYVVAEGVAAFLVYVAFALWVKRYFRAAWWVALSVYVPLYFTFVVPVRVNALFYPWDTWAVAFFTAGLYLIQQKRWGWFYLVFALATLNRETTCFLTVVYALTALGQDDWKKIGRHVSAQLVVWVLIKLGLALLYQDNPVEDRGETAFVDQSLFISMWDRNIAFLTNPLSYPYLVTALGGVWVPVLLCARRVGDAFVRRALWVSVPFVAGMAYVGLLGEYRIFGELIPLFTLAFLLVLRADEGAKTNRPRLPESG